MKSLAALFILLLGTASTLGQEKSPDPVAIAFFESHIRPVLANRCFGCHGPEKQKGGLRVDSLAALLEGGESGPALKRGKPDESRLIQAIRHGEALQMPPRMKLPPKEIADLTAWVKMGAPWPDANPAAVKSRPDAVEPTFTKEQTGHWAFQPVRRPVLPAVKDLAWARSPLDRFILARLEERGLAPAAAADPQTLLRRVTFDLVGLPPSAEDADAFAREWNASQASPATRQAVLEKVVDRLLASPHYGERWARHWLDVVRYADSNGMDENLVFGNAWRYRDYVIKAFNDDMPYDQFLREQIAGDLLATSDRPEAMIATSFLSIGPKMLAEDDPVKMEMDIIDEQLDTLGRALLGMTWGCSRCHDHKYDPFLTADYYSLAGILKSTQTMDNFRVVARWKERPIGSRADVEKAAQHAKAVADLKNEIHRTSQEHYQALLTEARSRSKEYLAAALSLKAQRVDRNSLLAAREDANIPGVILVEAEDFQRGNVIKTREGYGAKIGVIYNKGELPNFVEYDLKVADAGGYQIELRYAAAESRPVQVFVDRKVVVASGAGKVTGSWNPDTQTWFAETTVTLPAGHHVLRLERAGPFPHFDKVALVPLKRPVESSRTLEQWAQEKKLLPEFLKQWLEELQKKAAPKDAAELDMFSRDDKGPFRYTLAVENAYGPEIQQALRNHRDQLAKLEASVPVLPEAMAVADGNPINLRVHLRGNHLTLGKEVPRQFPRVFTSLKQPVIESKQSGRLQLAQWLTQSEHPLTSRVIVNRLWHWHFGGGLVRSVDNFGLLGEKPSHPELLDWLAQELVDSGWSLKAIHRTIVLSSTYQMSGAYHDAAFSADPDNRLHWRHPRRRLEAEVLRDSLFVLSGNLDAALGGSLFDATNRKYVPGYPNGNYDKYDIPRRSVYLPVIRSALYDVFQAFDFADPSFASGERAVTTVAPQALFLMNGKLVHAQTHAWATSLLADKQLDNAGRVRRIYGQAFGRPPSEREIARALKFVERSEIEWSGMKKSDARVQAWQSFCRVIVAANEFIYVE